MRTGFFVAALVSSIVSLLSEVYVTTLNDSLAPFIALVVVLIPSLVTGALISRYVRNRITHRIYLLFQEKIKDMRTKTGMSSFAGVERSYSKGGRRVSIIESQTPRILDEIGTNIMQLTSEKTKKEPPVFRSPHEVEMACRFIRDSDNPNALILMREIFEASFLQYPKDGYVHITAALYLLSLSTETTMLLRPDETNAEKAESLLAKISCMSVAFDVRFMAFFCEKLIEQSRKSKEVQNSELNISSYVEVLSSETFAKTYHIASLAELKAFWTCVRRGSTTRDYMAYPNYLRFIADATGKASLDTRDNYVSLISRFPKSKNMMRLYAQFSGTVLADMEEYRRLLTNAEELEDSEDSTDDVTLPSHRPSSMNAKPSMDKEDTSSLEAIDESETQHDIGNEGNENGGANDSKSSVQLLSGQQFTTVFRKSASSHGGSSQTSESREARRARAMRNEFVERLVRAPQVFNRRLQFLVVLSLLLATFAMGYAAEVFTSVGNDVNSFLTTTEIGRMGVAVSQTARLMAYFGSIGDRDSYERWKSELATNNNFVGNVSLPYLVDRATMKTGTVEVTLYDKIKTTISAAQPRTVLMNQYQLASAVNEYARGLLAEDMTFFQMYPPTIDKRLRFLLDNLLIIGESLKAVCDGGEADFSEKVQSELTLLWLAIVISLAIFVFYPLLTEVRTIQLRYLKHLQAIPKKTIDEILLIIDEQLEFLTQDGLETKLTSSTRQDGTRVGHRLNEAINVALSLVVVGAFACAILVPLIIRLPINLTYVSLVNYTGGRKYFVRITRTLGYEVLLGGRPEMYMETYLDKYQALHDNAISGHGEREITPTSSIEIIRHILTEPGCKTVCDPAIREYNSSYGITYDSVTAPVDQQINDYIRAGREFMVVNALAATRNFQDPHILYMESIQKDIVKALLVVDNLILQEFLPQGNNQALLIAIALFSAAVISISGIYTFNFRSLIRRRVQEMESIVSLMHMIPPSGAPDKLSRVIQSGGAISEDD
ncbi:hypothetical protein HDU93_008407 [Gonapodya sp. JEL0774]|nr:hypothetical protein HDU93_008407 [Gonapodya sp. JEL0774]